LKAKAALNGHAGTGKLLNGHGGKTNGHKMAAAKSEIFATTTDKGARKSRGGHASLS
jgi:hypothetical protein